MMLTELPPLVDPILLLKGKRYRAPHVAVARVPLGGAAGWDDAREPFEVLGVGRTPAEAHARARATLGTDVYGAMAASRGAIRNIHLTPEAGATLAGTALPGRHQLRRAGEFVSGRMAFPVFDLAPARPRTRAARGRAPEPSPQPTRRTTRTRSAPAATRALHPNVPIEALVDAYGHRVASMVRELAARHPHYRTKVQLNEIALRLANLIPPQQYPRRRA